MIYRLVYQAGNSAEGGIDLYVPGMAEEINKQTGVKEGNLDVLSPSLEMELNSAGTLTFTIPPSHKHWGLLEVFNGEVDVYEDGDLIWFGRPLQIVRDWNNQRVITCEGALSYFNDSVQFPKTYKTSKTLLYSDPEQPNKTGFLNDLLKTHNDQVSENRQIFLGNVTIPNVGVYREVDYDTTADCLQRMCLDVYGGYFMFRKEYDENNHVWVRYLDWYKEAPYGTDQKIHFGLNMLDISQDLNGSDIVTVLLPSGKDDLHVSGFKVVTEEDADKYWGCTHPVKDSPFIEHAEGVKKYGRVLAQKTFDDYSDKEELFKKAAEWLGDKNTDVVTIECTAADLHYIGDPDNRPAKFTVGAKVKVISQPHGLVGNVEQDDKNIIFPMYKISTSLDTGIKKITVGTPPKKELTDILAPSGGSTRSSGGSSTGNGGSGGSGGGGGSTSVPVKSVLVNGTTVVHNKVAEIVLEAGDGITLTEKEKGALEISATGAGSIVDVTLDGTSVVNEQGVAELQSQTIPVTDVQLNGTSVVQNTVANIQAVSDVTVNGDSVVNNGTAVLPAIHDVEANPVSEGSTELAKLKVDGTTYVIPAGDDVKDVRVRNSQYTTYSFDSDFNEVWNVEELIVVRYRDGNRDALWQLEWSDCVRNAVQLDGDVEVWYVGNNDSGTWYYKNLRDSRNHSAGYVFSWRWRGNNTVYKEKFITLYTSTVDENNISNIDLYNYSTDMFESKIYHDSSKPGLLGSSPTDIKIETIDGRDEEVVIMSDLDPDCINDDPEREALFAEVWEHLPDGGIKYISHTWNSREIVDDPDIYSYCPYTPKGKSDLCRLHMMGYGWVGNRKLYFTKHFDTPQKPYIIRGAFHWEPLNTRQTDTRGLFEEGPVPEGDMPGDVTGWPVPVELNVKLQTANVALYGSNDGENWDTIVDAWSPSSEGPASIWPHKGYKHLEDEYTGIYDELYAYKGIKDELYFECNQFYTYLKIMFEPTTYYQAGFYAYEVCGVPLTPENLIKHIWYKFGKGEWIRPNYFFSGRLNPTGGLNGDVYYKIGNQGSPIDIFGSPTSATPEGAVITSNFDVYDTYYPYFGFGDGNGAGNDGSDDELYIQYEFASGTSIVPVTLQFYDNFSIPNGYFTNGNLTMYGSNDGTTWDEIFTKSDCGTRDVLREFELDCNTSYRIFKFVMDSYSGYTGIKGIKCVGYHNASELIDSIWTKSKGTWIKQSAATVNYVDSEIATLQANFQDGVDDIYDACVAKGSTPASHSLSDVVSAIDAISGGGGGEIETVYSYEQTGSSLSDSLTYTVPYDGTLIVALFGYSYEITFKINNVRYPNFQPGGSWQYSINGSYPVEAGDLVEMSWSGSGATGMDGEIYLVKPASGGLTGTYPIKWTGEEGERTLPANTGTYYLFWVMTGWRSSYVELGNNAKVDSVTNGTFTELTTNHGGNESSYECCEMYRLYLIEKTDPTLDTTVTLTGECDDYNFCTLAGTPMFGNFTNFRASASLNSIPLISEYTILIVMEQTNRGDKVAPNRYANEIDVPWQQIGSTVYSGVQWGQVYILTKKGSAANLNIRGRLPNDFDGIKNVYLVSYATISVT